MLRFAKVQEAIRGLYSKKTAETCGPRLLENAEVQKAIAELSHVK